MHPQRSVITRALGTDPDVDVDTFPVEAEAGDVYLICSDGLSDMVDGDDDRAHPARRAAATSTPPRARSCTPRTARGGEDNITAVLFEIVEGERSRGEPDEQTRELARSARRRGHVAPRGRRGSAAAARGCRAGPDGRRHDGRAGRRHRRGDRRAGRRGDPQAGIGRRFLALLVIAALIAVIVALVRWGLAR